MEQTLAKGASAPGGYPPKNVREERAVYITAGWKKANLANLVFGVGLGAVICLFMTASSGKLVSFETFAGNAFFSVMISLGVINFIILAQTIFRLRYEKIWFVVVYYVASLLGMMVGTELARLIIACVREVPYTFSRQQDILFRSLIVFIVCTAGYIYHARKVSLLARLREKELEMVKLSQLKTQAELATLHARINPHFLYNSLNSIASLIHIDPDKAESMTLKLSKLFRYSINYDQEDLVRVKDEIETGKTYLDLEKVRFGDRIDFRIEVDEALLEAKIPRFLIQPLVENALKHGLKNTVSDGELRVSLQQQGEQVELIVADNGVPFPAELQTGYGLQSTYDKLSLLYGEDYELSISNNPVKQIKILIPLKYE